MRNINSYALPFFCSIRIFDFTWTSRLLILIHLRDKSPNFLFRTWIFLQNYLERFSYIFVSPSGPYVTSEPLEFDIIRESVSLFFEPSKYRA